MLPHYQLFYALNLKSQLGAGKLSPQYLLAYVPSNSLLHVFHLNQTLCSRPHNYCS